MLLSVISGVILSPEVPHALTQLSRCLQAGTRGTSPGQRQRDLHPTLPESAACLALNGRDSDPVVGTRRPQRGSVPRRSDIRLGFRV